MAWSSRGSFEIRPLSVLLAALGLVVALGGCSSSSPTSPTSSPTASPTSASATATPVFGESPPAGPTPALSSTPQPPLPTPTGQPPLVILEPVSGVEVRTPAVSIEGEAVPGSALTVNGAAVELGASGDFIAAVVLTEGENLIDISGRTPEGLPFKETVRVVYVPCCPEVAE